AQRAWLPAVPRRVGKQVAGERQKARFAPEPALLFVKRMSKVLFNLGVLRVARLIFELFRHMHAVHAVALREADPDMLALGIFVVAPLAALRRGTDTDHVHGPVRL